MFRMAGKIMRLAVCGALLMSGGAAFALSPAGTMSALRQLEKGQWELRQRGAGTTSAAPRRICVVNPSQLLQVKHGEGGCSRFIVADTPQRAVVTYQCEGRGGGRTDLRVETPRLVQINVQGVANGAPFVEAIEARRTGACH